MSSLAIRIERAAAFKDEADALMPVGALISALASATVRGRLWAQFQGVPLELDGDTIELLLKEDRSNEADDAATPTHVLSLSALPEGPSEIGVLSLWLTPEPDPTVRAAPSLKLSASIPADSFDTRSDTIRHLLDACLDAVSPDLALVGPRDWLRDLRAGWATFTRTAHRELLPAGAVTIPTHGGMLILAHAEDPASASPAAREAVAHVRAAIDWRPPSPPPEPSPVLPAPSAETAEPLPTYLALSRAALTGTSLSVDVPRGPAVPFVESTSPALRLPPTLPVHIQLLAATLPLSEAPSTGASPNDPLAALRGTLDAVPGPRGPALPFVAAPVEGSPLARPSGHPGARAPIVASPGADLRETLEVVDVRRGPVLPFNAAPDLNLEDYARFRARLAVKGENDPETLRYYGIPTALIKEALQERFAIRFRQDPEAQRRFVELVQKFVAELREQATKR